MLRTKTHIPKPSSNLVHRKDLFEKLEEGLNRKLILISAPAGFGKSCLLSDWIDKEKILACWYSIDTRDNDPKEFLKYFIAAAQGLNKEIGVSSLNMLNSPEKINPGHIIEILINDLFLVEENSLIVLDDFHLIDSKEINNTMMFILENLPETVHVAITTRSDPSFSISRLRSQNNVLEIRASELSFTTDPIREFFNKKLKFDLLDEDLEILRTKTEGWIAGLQLIGISMQNRDDHQEFIKNLAGDNRYIMDYLIEEVLNTLPEDYKDFLINTSLFERINSSFCNYVLERSDSQQMIEKLEHDNMFIIPQDSKRVWYRYHHLFSDLLKQRLLVNNTKQVKNIRLRASEWYDANDNKLAAIEQLLLAKEQEKALAVLNEVSDDFLVYAKHFPIYNLGNQFDEEYLIKSPNFCINYAWMLIVFGETAKAMKLLNESHAYIQKNKDQQKQIGKLYLTYTMFFIYSGDLERAMKYSELAKLNAPGINNFWDIWTQIAFGEVSLLKFEIDDAYEAYMDAYKVSKINSNPYLILIATAKASHTLILRGQITQSYDLCNNLLEEIENNKVLDSLSVEILSSILYSIMGYILTEWNMIDKGTMYAHKGFKSSQKALSTSFRGYCILLYSETLFLSGEYEKALEYLNKIYEIENLKTVRWLDILSYSLVNRIKFKLENSKTEIGEPVLYEKNEGLSKFEDYYLISVKARSLIHEYKAKEVLELLNPVVRQLEKSGRGAMLREAELLRARAYKLLGDDQKAIETIVRVLNLAHKEKYIRTFLVDGEEIKELIKMIPKEQVVLNPKAKTSVSKQYVEKLLEAFSKEKNQSEEIILSNRELDVLKLIADDLSNQEISDTLFISLNTVKTHIKNIHLKLNVDSRAKAVTKAKETGILN